MSDFFPRPFELDAIRHSWSSIRPLLQALDLRTYLPRRTYRMLAPKHNYTLRPIDIPDPIDTILFAATILRVAPAIQTKRDQYSADVVFSTSYDPSRTGAQIIDSHWSDHLERVDTLLKAASTIGTADISDFFQRIYHHRLENALIDATGDADSTFVIMRFLRAWSGGASYGIPIGPPITRLLAEVTLIEVDQYLLSIGAQFTRYTDDYTIYAQSESDCLRVIYELGSRLLGAEGLTLNMEKTTVRSAAEFRRWRFSPGQAEREIQKQIIDVVFNGDIYAAVDYDELTDEQRALVDRVDAESWLNAALNAQPADLRTVRFVLNFLSALRRPELASPVIENFSRLLPVSEAVARFFDVFDDLDAARRQVIGADILRYLTGAHFVPAYQSMWLLDPFVNAADWDNLSEIRLIARNDKNLMVRRQAVCAIGRSRDRSALWDCRLAYDDTTDWEKRAIIYACRHLPADERNAFYLSLGLGRNWTRENALTRCVVEWAKVAP